eukprot:gene5950-11303_t
MYKRLALILLFAAWAQLASANYRTCNCFIRTEDEANAPVLVSWSDRLSSCGLFCGFPGFHVSCDEVKSWCPNNCFNKAKSKLRSNAELDKMCERHGKIVSAQNGIHMYAYSKVMNNCGAAWDHYNLNAKLCCFVLRPQNRWIGYIC